ncbi:MAG TPA: NAD(P)(+) transhydrogenase (Re/Si-specific) subunit beta [Mycobacteriales bacterium]|nr:NAD(P)(+) transhydrogenase (Re/Si-specific) subunit beta [Mycobacteriales bacterium]
MTGVPLELAYLLAAICFVLALRGLSSPPTARSGNLIGAFGAAVAVVATFAMRGLGNRVAILIAVLVGSAIAVPTARRVRMTAMPQLVAIFNGVGGGAAALVSIVEFVRAGPGESLGVVAAVVFSAIVGCISFTGSGITFAKLQELLTGRPITFPGGSVLSAAVAGAAVVLGLLVLLTDSVLLLVLSALLALVFGVLFVLPVGGADVPVVISLLNAFTGLTVAASGYVLNNVLLIVAGTLVGASGTLLTQLMSKAMGRPITNILFGAFAGGSTMGATAIAGADTRPVRSASADDIAILLAYARKVIVVPGYGLAVAQAQHALRELADVLADRGVEVLYGIHPVAGRMPGHMNVLLAEADVPYEQLKEMDEVNPQFPSTDVVLVIGANDVVNPAAKSSPGSPIYGMPIMEVDQAQNVVFLKRSMRPGFAGIENELLYNPKTTLLFGDAKESLTQLVAAVKAS